jgi:hypothetical protein
MLRSDDRHVKQPNFIVVWDWTALSTAKPEVVRHPHPLPFEALGAWKVAIT